MIEAPIVIVALGKAADSSGQCDCDCDCACDLVATAGSNLSGHLAATALAGAQRLYRSYPSYSLRLDSDYTTYYGPGHRVAVLNQPAVTLLSHLDHSHSLKNLAGASRERWGDQAIQNTIQEMIASGLLVADHRAASTTESSTTLSAWLHITDRCNLRCTYCYLPHVRADMSFETGCAAIDATFRSAVAHNYSKVKLKYAGGEAMLRFPLLMKLHRYAQDRASHYGLSVDGVVLSNGTLLTEKNIRALQAQSLRLMISLDGLAEAHDRQRPFADGHGSATFVTQAIDLALAHALVPDISITLSGRNIDGLPKLMEWVLDRELPFSLNFYRENDLSASARDLRVEEERIITGLLAAYQVIEFNLPRRSLLASLVDLSNLSASHVRTCNLGHSYLVFDYQGHVSKCQMQINTPVTTVHTSDPLALIQADQLGIQNVSVEEKEGCRSCEWKYWCTGGCPLTTFRATGRYDVKSPNCNIYKALYPAAIRLEGLRLLKYGAASSTSALSSESQRM